MKNLIAKVSLGAAICAMALAFAPTASEAAMCTSYCSKYTKWCTEKYVSKSGYKWYTPMVCKEGSCPKKC